MEGPVVPNKDNLGRCAVEVLSDCRARACPSDRLISLREMTDRDEAILQAVNETTYRESTALKECLALAEWEGESLSESALHPDDERQSYNSTRPEKEQLNHSFLLANYQKKDRK